jgi:hypothetical protein
MDFHASPNHQPDSSYASIRMDARLDTDMRQKVDNLAGHFRQPRAAVLHHIMQWGLEHGAMLTGD